MHPMTVDRLTEDAQDIANTRISSGQAAQMAGLCCVLELDEDGNAAKAGWEEKFISLADSVLWSAAYFSVEDGTVICGGSHGRSAPGRFNAIFDLRYAGSFIDFEESNHTTTGFCIVVGSSSSGSKAVKIAPKRFKDLLEWGAVLHQGVSEVQNLFSYPGGRYGYFGGGHGAWRGQGRQKEQRSSSAGENGFFSDSDNSRRGSSSLSRSSLKSTKDWVGAYRRRKARSAGPK